ncbi:tetratricopeptide repeat protein [Alloiococcus sp. CFN-8]|uniref:tetratricopeptide repeat protein n=1 Tax=Alloiococcus sp. CFN-8 TaxID=3416081 RepID=UPI003CEFE203
MVNLLNEKDYFKKIDELLSMSSLNYSEIERTVLEAIEDKLPAEDARNISKLLEYCELPYAKVKLYKYLGDKSVVANSYHDAVAYYTIAVDIADESDFKEEKLLLYNNIGACKLMEVQYEEAIYYFNNVLILSNRLKSFSVYKKSIYNLALAYFSVFKIDDTLRIINNMDQYLDKRENKVIYIKMKILEAQCYEEKGLLIKAVKVYEELLSEEKDIPPILLGNIYNNIANNMLLQKNYEKSRELFEKAYEIRKDEEYGNISHVLINSASLYLEINDMKEFFKRIKEGLELCRKENDYEYIITGLLKLEAAYRKLHDKEKLKEVYLEMLKVAEENNLRKDTMYALNKLISMEIKDKNYREAYIYNNKLNNYIENIVNN